MPNVLAIAYLYIQQTQSYISIDLKSCDWLPDELDKKWLFNC